MRKKNSSFGKNTILIAIGRLSTQLAGLLIVPIYTFFINPSDYGFVDLALTYIGILTPLITLRFDLGVFRFLIDARGNKEKSTSIISSAFKILAPFISLLVIIALALNLFVDVQYGWLIIANAITVIVAGVVAEIIRGLGNNKDYTVSMVLSAVSLVLSAMVSVVLLGLGAAGVLIASIVSHLVIILYSLVRLRLHKYISLKAVDKTFQKDLLRYSLPLIPEGILWWVMQVSDRTVVSAVLGFASNGIYSIANRIGAVVNGAVSILWMSWTQSSAEEVDSPDAGKFFSSIGNNYYIRLLGSFCLLLLPVTSILFDVIIGQDYAEAYLYVPGVIVAAFGSGLLGYVAAIYNAKKMTKELAVTTVVPAIINIVVNLALVGIIGLWAAVISTIVSYYIMFAWRYIKIKKVTKIKLDIPAILSIAVAFIAVATLYYINNPILNFVSISVSAVYALFMNREFVAKALNKLYNIRNYRKRI